MRSSWNSLVCLGNSPRDSLPDDEGMNNNSDFRARVLAQLGAAGDETVELLRYNENIFDQSQALSYDFPLADEPFVKTWEQYVAEVRDNGTISVLAQYLVELRFPICSGMSSTKDYRSATRRGTDSRESSIASGLRLQSPGQCRVMLHQTIAGRIPLIIAPLREDFVTLVQALAMHNEPILIPDSMGALMVSGHNNWHRIQMLAQDLDWDLRSERSRSECFQYLEQHKDLYQDRFIILSEGPYSGVPARDLNLSNDEWDKLSFVIRREHECTHYATRRIFSSMRNNLLDELIADVNGIIAASGCFRGNWLLRFFGLESFPNYREGGRLENYLGDPCLSEGAFALLQVILKRAIENLELFYCNCANELRRPELRPVLLMTLAGFTAEELASDEAFMLLSKRFRALRTKFSNRALPSKLKCGLTGFGSCS
jgi:hypothetical protein